MEGMVGPGERIQTISIECGFILYCPGHDGWVVIRIRDDGEI